ncbi:MAG: DNA-formamidopyrimidine glycosylase [Caldimicrobium sp.]|nr:DNA-formamidopyrimidine glycosylase [Caldimicrobium sp.]MDW8183574.1 DNA-formamidopyrimidine glycosylase [Caldimicrobium sp.]
MPELPEIETIKRDLERTLLHDKLIEVRVFDKDFISKRGPGTQELKTLISQDLTSIERKGKILILKFSSKALLFHLGMTGALIYQKDHPPIDRGKHLILNLSFQGGQLIFRDIRKFSRIWIIPNNGLHPWLDDNLGPDALEISKEAFFNLMQKTNRRVKTILLDQKRIAGLGNIYADELLFRAKISPLRPANSLLPEEIELLYEHMRQLLSEAIELRGSSIKDYVDGLGLKGFFQERHQVYGKRNLPCQKCGNPLVFTIINSRGTTFCPSCQR